MAIAASGIILGKWNTQPKRKSIHTSTVADFSDLQGRTNVTCSCSNALWLEARESWVCSRRRQKFFCSLRSLKAYRESRITAQPILNFATRRGECLTSRSGRFTPRKIPGTHWIAALVGTRVIPLAPTGNGASNCPSRSLVAKPTTLTLLPEEYKGMSVHWTNSLQIHGTACARSKWTKINFLP